MAKIKAKAKLKAKAKVKPQGKTKAKAKSRAKAPEKTPITQHKASCDTFSGAPATWCADYNQKMYVCQSCGAPNGTPQMAKNAFNVMEEVAKLSEKIKASAKRAKAVKMEAPTVEAAAVEAAPSAEAAPATPTAPEANVEGQPL